MSAIKKVNISDAKQIEKEELVKKFFKDIYSVLISAKYQKLSKEEIVIISNKTISLFQKKF